MTARRETIEVGYQPITGTGHYHKYIVYTDSGGNKFVAHGHPNAPLIDVVNPVGPDVNFEASTGDAERQWDPDPTESAEIWPKDSVRTTSNRSRAGKICRTPGRKSWRR